MNLDARRIAIVLTLLVLALLGIHVVIQLWHYQHGPVPWPVRQLFDVDEENNLPTWYSSAALLAAAFVLCVTTKQKQAGHDPWSRYWLGLTLGFLLMSVDEIAGIHETYNTVTNVSWTLTGAVVSGLLAVIYWRFLAHLPRRIAALFVLAGTMFLSGALGVEFATDWYAQNAALDTLAYNLWTAVEEGLEMGAVVVFIYAQLCYMSGGRPVQITITQRTRD
jgi:hypothetical protein